MLPRASSPGKIILGGEHAVVFGRSAIAVAIDKRASVRISDLTLENLNDFTDFLKRFAGGKLAISSDIPAAAGLGSSAAILSAVAALLDGMEHMPFSEESIARRAFHMELEYQKGSGSPIDTTVSTHGYAVAVNFKADDFLWRIEKNGTEWSFYSMAIPEWPFIVVDSGIPKSTSLMVKKVAEKVREGGMVHVDRIDSIVREMALAISRKDIERTGRLMNENEAELESLGVKHPATSEIIEMLRDLALGVKVTGAGGGGSVIALADEDSAVRIVKVAEEHGLNCFVFRAGTAGVTLESDE